MVSDRGKGLGFARINANGVRLEKTYHISEFRIFLRKFTDSTAAVCSRTPLVFIRVNLVSLPLSGSISVIRALHSRLSTIYSHF